MRQSVVIRNDLKEIKTVMTAFEVFAEQNDIPMPVIMKFKIIFDELLNNIVSYGYDDEGDHEVDVKMELLGKRLTVTVSDDGIPFDPLSKETPDIEALIEDREMGGLGIHNIRALTDEVIYQRRIDRNILTMVKNINE